MSAVNRLIEHVSVLASKASYFLLKLLASVGHQFVVTLIPQLIPMSERPRYATAHRFQKLLINCLGIGWR